MARQQSDKTQPMQRYLGDFSKDGFIPIIPVEYRGAEALGVRTRPDGSNKETLGTSMPGFGRPKQREAWNKLGEAEKWVMLNISEHRHLTTQQLSYLCVLPGTITGEVEHKGLYQLYIDIMERYGVRDVEWHRQTWCRSTKGLEKLLERLAEQDMLYKVDPAYSISEKTEERLENPALWCTHWYLSKKGALTLASSTKAKYGVKEGNTKLGYVPSHKEAMVSSIVHETECNEVFSSLVSAAQYINSFKNPSFGYYEICRWLHEMNTESEIPALNKDYMIKFKPDGMMTMYMSPLCGFVDLYLEYDAGSSTTDKICYKTEAFIKFAVQEQEAGRRVPALLMVTQKPSEFIEGISTKSKSKYLSSMSKAWNLKRTHLKGNVDEALIPPILVSDCASIRARSALGAVWHPVDVVNGSVQMTAIDLPTALMDRCSLL